MLAPKTIRVGFVRFLWPVLISIRTSHHAFSAQRQHTEQQSRVTIDALDGDTFASAQNNNARVDIRYAARKDILKCPLNRFVRDLS